MAERVKFDKNYDKRTVWTLFILDFDGTYDNEDNYDNGVEPLVYLIPLDKQAEVERIAQKASYAFNTDEDGCCWCIGDYFEEFLSQKKIDFQMIGSIDLTFGERQVNYLADYIPREVV